jgi:hypothetical protein
MKVIILIPLWQRPDVFNLVAANLRHFIQNSPHSIRIVCVVSDEDPYYADLMDIAIAHGCNIFHHPNLPLAVKINEAVKDCYHLFEFDYLMNFGSDNLIHPDIWKIYNTPMERGEQFFGINNVYFVEPVRDRAIHYLQYNNQGAIGAGRMIGYKIIRSMMIRRLLIYEPDRNRGLDSCSRRRIRTLNDIKELVIDAGRFPYIVDIKTETNINSFSSLCYTTNKINHIKPKRVMEHFPGISTSSMPRVTGR